LVLSQYQVEEFLNKRGESLFYAYTSHTLLAIV
jgi:hypothetical protein